MHYYRCEYERVVGVATDNLTALPTDWIYEYLSASAPPSVYDRSWLIQSLANLGRFTEAAAYEAEALELAEPTRHPFTIGQAHRAAVALHILKGDWAGARSFSERWIVGIRTGNVVIQLPWAIAASAWILAQLGEASNALDRLREGAQLLQHQVQRELIVTCGWDYHCLGRSCLLLGQLDEAQRLGERAVEFSTRQPGYAAHALHLLGDIANNPDRFDAEAGKAHYFNALGLAEPRGMLPLVARCHFGLATLYLRTDRRQLAREHLIIATTLYKKMDMKHYLAQAEKEMTALA